jgi:two-component system, chemotaxis family, sensor kinase Cph1
MTKSAQPADPTSCDQEPIHIPGSIQPHGILLAIDPETATVIQVAGETERLLGRTVTQILNEPVGEVLGSDPAMLIQSSSNGPLAEPVFLGSISVPAASRMLDVVAHRRDGLLILEMEPAEAHRDSAARMLAKLHAISTELETQLDLTRLCRAAAREMRSLIGFDRVMIYRFLEDKSGCVVAEAKIAELAPFLNHHYPASDIPRQARALYVRSPVRLIPDVNYAPAPLIPALCPATNEPLDMSDCWLRSVSPTHIQYLKNMGVAASMSISIVIEGTLWGLIACHHASPKQVPYELREASKHVGQILSQLIRARQEASHHTETLRLSSTRDELSWTLARSEAVDKALLEHGPALFTLIPADGAAIRFGEEVLCIGHAPPEAEVKKLTAWIMNSSRPDPYATDVLAERYGPASDPAFQMAGILATVVSRETPLVLMWFRAEYVQTINWAGNPHKPVEPGTNLGTLTPRKSFDAWQETVRNRSRAWSSAEVNGVRKFRDTVFDLLQRQRLRELNLQLRRTLSDKEELLEQKNLRMQEVNHRVQNSLHLVNSMLSIQERETSDPTIRSHFEEARQRIIAVSTVHQRLWRSDQIQNVEFGTYLRELRDGLVEVWGRSWDQHVTIHAPPILLPTDRAIILALVITELLTNAIKYAYPEGVGPIDVTVQEQVRATIRVTVADCGGGMPSETRRSGFGSRLTKTLISQLEGDIEIMTNASGTRVILTVPHSMHTDAP